MNEAPLSKHSPEGIKYATMLRRIKKVDDVARLVDEPYRTFLRDRLKDLASLARAAVEELHDQPASGG